MSETVDLVSGLKSSMLILSPSINSHVISTKLWGEGLWMVAQRIQKQNDTFSYTFVQVLQLIPHTSMSLDLHSIMTRSHYPDMWDLKDNVNYHQMICPPTQEHCVGCGDWLTWTDNPWSHQRHLRFHNITYYWLLGWEVGHCILLYWQGPFFWRLK